MIKEITGDLIRMAKKGRFDVIIHGTNCFTIMGVGVAKQIAKEFPEAYRADLKTLHGDIYKLGEYSYHYYKDLRLKIINLYSQYKTGSNAEYSAIGLGLRNIANSLKGDEKIGICKIGCGIGGLEWQIVKELISHELADFDVTIVNLSLPNINNKKVEVKLF